MKDKMISIGLYILVILFIPIFFTTLMTGLGQYDTGGNERMVRIDYGQGVKELPLEKYLIGVVASEMPARFHEEALKAQAIAARTYTIKRLEENPEIIFTDEQQSYFSDEELESIWDVTEYPIYYAQILSAVKETEGLVITYEGALIDAIFHSTSTGMTRSALSIWGEDIPYLQVAESLDDVNAPTYLHEYQWGYDEFTRKAIEYRTDLILGEDLAQEIQIVERGEDGYVKSLQMGNITFTGEEFRKIFGLASSHFTITYNEGQVEILCKGYGHGVGLSQYGADAMARAGSTCEEILTHYYLGVKIERKI